MNVLGYINYNHLFDTESNCINALKEQNCSIVYSEKMDDFSCKEWKNFINSLDKGDTAVFISFGSAFKDSLQFVFFYKLCDKNDIRIISVQDGVDTVETAARNALGAISRLRCSTKSSSDNANAQFEAELVTKPREVSICRKHKTVINMYNADYGIAQIKETTGYKAKSQIFQILDKYHIERRHPHLSHKKKS